MLMEFIGIMTGNRRHWLRRARDWLRLLKILYQNLDSEEAFAHKRDGFFCSPPISRILQM